MARNLLIAVVMVACVPVAHASPNVVGVHLVSRVGDGPFTSSAKRAKQGTTVELAAVVEARHRGQPVFFSSASRVRLGRKSLTPRPLADLAGATFDFRKVEPSVETLSNTETGSFAFSDIPYKETPLTRNTSGVAVADVRPTLTPDRGAGVGTMRYRLILTHDGQTFSTPGADARRGRGSGGLKDTVHRISIRRDDSYLGLLTEMYGQPYIWASAGTSDKKHQSERLEGSDCADFIVYGLRRQGYRIPYVWTGSLPKYTRRIARGTPQDGVYKDDRGKPIPFPKPGDIVLFPRHVGALVEDRGTIGLLDPADVMVHTYFASPREQPISETPYGATWIEVHRPKR